MAIAKWTLHHTWVICVGYLVSMIVLLLIHGAFGFSMNDDGTYLSNALMHIGSGAILGMGTGLLQKELLKKYFHVPTFWMFSLVIGFVFAELVAGFVLWKLEIYRGLINLFNTDHHLPEASIFALAGLISGILQYRFLKPCGKGRFYWIIASTLGWGLLILSTFPGLYGFILGAILYGLITGFVLFNITGLKNQMNT